MAASVAAVAAAPAAAAEPAAEEAEPAAADASAAGAEGTTTTGAGVTTTGAGAAASSFLPQAARATAATTAAKTRDLFIFTILDDIEENNFRKLPKETQTRIQVMF
ncbi:MAG: hypothetical protein ABIV07_12300 [Polaromonas sp.]